MNKYINNPFLVTNFENKTFFLCISIMYALSAMWDYM